MSFICVCLFCASFVYYVIDAYKDSVKTDIGKDKDCGNHMYMLLSSLSLKPRNRSCNKGQHVRHDLDIVCDTSLSWETFYSSPPPARYNVFAGSTWSACPCLRHVTLSSFKNPYSPAFLKLIFARDTHCLRHKCTSDKFEYKRDMPKVKVTVTGNGNCVLLFIILARSDGILCGF